MVTATATANLRREMASLLRQPMEVVVRDIGKGGPILSQRAIEFHAALLRPLVRGESEEEAISPVDEETHL